MHVITKIVDRVINAKTSISHAPKKVVRYREMQLGAIIIAKCGASTNKSWCHVVRQNFFL